MPANPLNRAALDEFAEVLTGELRAFRVAVLVEQRALLQKRLVRLAERIISLGGRRRSARDPRGMVAHTRKPGENLRDKLVEVMRAAGGPVRVRDLPDLLRKAGYQTVSDLKHLVTSIYHTLADRTLFRKVRRGIYALAKAPARRRAAKRKRRAKAVEANAK